MNMTFKEKIVGGSLISIVLVYGYYFYRIIATDIHPEENVYLFISAVVALVVLHIGITIIAALFNHREAEMDGDERDMLIELKAIRIASVALGAGAILSASLWLVDVTPLTMANAILLSLVIAEVIQRLMQLFYYRMGV